MNTLNNGKNLEFDSVQPSEATRSSESDSQLAGKAAIILFTAWWHCLSVYVCLQSLNFLSIHYNIVLGYDIEDISSLEDIKIAYTIQNSYFISKLALFFNRHKENHVSTHSFVNHFLFWTSRHPEGTQGEMFWGWSTFLRCDTCSQATL